MSGATLKLPGFYGAAFRFFSSLKLAVVVVVGLAASLAAATILESLYDTPTAQFYVYRSAWFYGVLLLLGVNILCVALSRLPWKKRQIPFLMAHAGILTLLTGAWLTDRFGLDGSVRIAEGETGTVVETNQPELLITDSQGAKIYPIRWLPPGVPFKELEIPEYELKVDQFLSHAEPSYSFEPNENAEYPALELKLTGGPMRITQEFWLWAGDPNWKAMQMGPALFGISGPEETLKPAQKGRPEIFFTPEGGSLRYRATSSSGEIKEAKLKLDAIVGQVIEPGWKGGVKLEILKFIPKAISHITYQLAHQLYGEQAPSSAIHVIAGGGQSETWLGLGDRVALRAHGKEVQLGYFPKRSVLPFGIRLERFTLTHYEGTQNPSTYSSLVSVADGPDSLNNVDITMNEPLQHRGLTFYQASYEDAQPRPTVTVLSVNQDPGRPFKYTGSLLIVLGSILLFASKYRKAKK